MTSRPARAATIEQLVAAIVALDLWEGENTPEELEQEARRLGRWRGLPNVGL